MCLDNAYKCVIFKKDSETNEYIQVHNINKIQIGSTIAILADINFFRAYKYELEKMIEPSEINDANNDNDSSSLKKYKKNLILFTDSRQDAAKLAAGVEGIQLAVEIMRDQRKELQKLVDNSDNIQEKEELIQAIKNWIDDSSRSVILLEGNLICIYQHILH